MAALQLVTGRRGAVVRAGADLDSAKLAELPRGALVYVVARSRSACGAARARLAHPVAGWCSDKVLGGFSWPKARTREEAVGFEPGEASSITEARWDAEEACASAGGFAGAVPGYRFVSPSERRVAPAAREACEAWCVGLASDEFRPAVKNQRVCLPETVGGPWGDANPLSKLGECADGTFAAWRGRGETSRGDAAGVAWIVRGDESPPRRG